MKSVMHTFFRICVYLAIVVGCWLPVSSYTQQNVSYASLTKDCLSITWPHEESDLQPDDTLHFGRLQNGLRYVLMRNAEPKDRVGLYLNVQAGSLYEDDSQQGLAHFLEHMLFNGTTHYPPGKLIKYFQSIGMGFGGDTNAYTGYDETVYNLLLPSASEKALDEGFLVLADYARGALLLEEEVNRERGVILAEKRARDTAASRVRKEQLAFDFSGTKISKRNPIGKEEVIKTADAALLRSFYDTWYRPENIVVVAVGDMDVTQAEALLKKHFAPLQGTPHQITCPELGNVAKKGKDTFYLYEPELGYTELSIGTVYNIQPHADTRAWEKLQLQEYIAVSILNNRLEKISRKAGSPFTEANVYKGIFSGQFAYINLVVQTGKDTWQESMALLKNSLEEMLSQGTSQAELDRVKKELTAHLKKQVQTAETRDSRALAKDIIRKINSNEVMLSPEQELELYLPMLENMTLDQVDRAMQAIWGRERRLYEVVGTADLRDKEQSPEDIILKSVEHPVAVDGFTWKDDHSVKFPYLEINTPPAAIVSREFDKDIKVQRVTLDNNVVLQIKSTPFQKNQVNVAIHFGHGKAGEPEPGMAMVAEPFVLESGVGRLTAEQLKEALAGTNIEYRFNVRPESFVYTGSCLNSELEQLLQLLYTALHDPGFRDNAWKTTQQRLGQLYDRLESSVEGMMQIKGETFLEGGGRLYGLAEHQQVASLSMEQVVSWLETAFQSAPLEINIVGDVDEEQAITLVRKYFAGHERKPAKSSPAHQVSFPTGKQENITVHSSIDKALVTVAWKTNDFWDISRTRRLNILASVLDDRLRMTIREELGATYSPVVYNRSSRVYPGYGVLRAQLIVASGQAETIAEIVKRVAKELTNTSIPESELHRALEPTLTSIRDYKRDNRYWLDSVLSLATRHPEQLQWPLSILPDFQSISVDDIRQIALEYLQPEKAAMVIISSPQ
ncbi:M16 family metallopeptidase [Desulfogranum japonicum]|uniref:M16 family metallopeptidase n=1 Tax=Desulfogranum japonicum TaxID=231447 RepID=UPI0004901602|nr:M16 family metallopeptidase [Desulfogranum japonicum]